MSARDSQIYIPSSLRWKLALIARARNLKNSDAVFVSVSADSVATELLEQAIDQKYPQFAEKWKEKEQLDNQLMESIV